MSKQLAKRIQAKKAVVAVIGLGYVGLPLAMGFAKKGFKVYGVDSDRDRVKRLKNKESYILDIAAGDITRAIQKNAFEPTNDFQTLRLADVVIICVPTPLKRKYTPDISYILNAVKSVRKFLKKDMLVVLESTTYPGTTEELLKPELEKSGLKAEVDFYLAFSPERIDPGNIKYGLAKIPKLVGGLSARSGELAKLLYGQIIEKVFTVSSAKTAEMTKLVENSFRIVNIGWANEVAMICHKLGIDVWEVIEAAKTKPFGFMPFYPGLGAGGHCIPDDPLYLYWKAKHHGVSSKFLKLSADINAFMPQYALNRLAEALRENKILLRRSRILVIGVTYKKDVKDLRKSPALKFIELLQRSHCKVSYFDPLIPYLDINSIQLKSMKWNKKTLAGFDCAVIATDHSNIDYELLRAESKLIFDTRNVYRHVKEEKIIRL